jgi:hypothetical protein
MPLQMVSAQRNVRSSRSYGTNVDWLHTMPRFIRMQAMISQVSLYAIPSPWPIQTLVNATRRAFSASSQPATEILIGLVYPDARPQQCVTSAAMHVSSPAVVKVESRRFWSNVQHTTACETYKERIVLHSKLNLSSPIPALGSAPCSPSSTSSPPSMDVLAFAMESLCEDTLFQD